MPRISSATIDRLKNIDLVDAIATHFVTDLKKKGTSYVGLSPFTNEKSPSFTVSPTKGFYKCFSSGNFGFDVIRLYGQIHPHLDFPDIIKELAYLLGEEIEYEEITPEQEAAEKKEREEKKKLSKLMEFALMHFLSNDIPEQFNKIRQYNKSTLDAFQIGYAKDEWNDFTDRAIEEGYTEDVLLASGLCKKSESKGNLYDFMRDRVVFPIFDIYGRPVAFSGRAMVPTDKNPKYLHASGSPMNQLIFGIKQAKEHFKDRKCYAVEGPTDVLRSYEKGFQNTVCSSGGAFSEAHFKTLLKMGIDTLAFVPDNDLVKLKEKGENPGIKNLHSNAKKALENGINNIRVLVPEKEKKQGDTMIKVREDFDPDNFLQKLRTKDDVENWRKKERDYITEYLLDECERLGESGGPSEQVAQHRRMSEIINAIADDQYRVVYHDAVCSSGSFWKLFKKNHRVKESSHNVDLAVLDKMTQEQKGDFWNYGFQEENNKYLFGDKKEVSNFIFEVLFYVYSNEDSKFVCMLKHSNGRSKIAPISGKDFITLNALKTTLIHHGPNWQFFGRQEQLDRIKMKIFEGVKEAREPIYMGWNTGQNFFTFSNGVFYGGLFFEANKHGIVTIKKSVKSLDEFHKLKPDEQIEIGQHHYVIKQNPKEIAENIGIDNLMDLIAQKKVYRMEYYFLPFASSLKISNVEDDDFEFERNIVYKKDSEKLHFDQWAKQINLVYGDNGNIMIAFYIMALFRDIIYKGNNNWVPMLCHYGMPGSGKSKAAESLIYMFGEVIEDGINLESGSTEVGIRRYLASSSNTLIHLNEYKNTLPISKIGLLKGIADGSGKITGRKTTGNQVKTYKPKSTAIICGQDIPTVDPALIERCIFSDFDKTNRNKEAYDELKKWEQEGRCTHVTAELLGHREFVDEYKKTEPEITKTIYTALEKKDMKVDERPVLNASSILTPVFLLMKHTDLQFPFTFNQLLDIMISRVELQVSIKSAEDDVEQFFTVMNYCADMHEVNEGEHYEIRRDEQKTVLYIRLRQIMSSYKKYAKQTEVIPLQESTLKSYFEKHASYLGINKHMRFVGLKNQTSAMMFDYEILMNQGVELKTSVEIDTPNEVTTKAFLFKMLNNFPVGTSQEVDDITKHIALHAKRKVSNDELMAMLNEYKEEPNAKKGLRIWENEITIIEKEPF